MTTNENVIRLVIAGLGHVPSYKNRKLMCRGKLITDPAKKEWMERAIRSIEFQLHGMFPTAAGVMRVVCPKRLPTALCLPLDDSWEWMIPGQQNVKRVALGSEGCEITIEKL
jgi:hypothetical protein